MPVHSLPKRKRFVKFADITFLRAFLKRHSHDLHASRPAIVLHGAKKIFA